MQSRAAVVQHWIERGAVTCKARGSWCHVSAVPWDDGCAVCLLFWSSQAPHSCQCVRLSSRPKELTSEIRQGRMNNGK